MRVGTKRGIRIAVAVLAASLLPVVPAAAVELRTPTPRTTGLDLRIQQLAERQREMLGIPDAFFPFLEDDARVRTGRAMWGDAVPDMTRDNSADVIETDLRYRYEIGGRQDPLRTVDAQTNTRITLRSGRSGKKIWKKKFDRDAYPFSMRVGRDGRHGIVVMSGLWNFYATTEESTLRFDAFDRKGKHLWTQEFRSISYYDMLGYVTEDALMVAAPFNGIRGRADDLLIGLATMVSPLWDAQTTTVRTLTIDGRDGSQTAHPVVDIGIDWWPVPLPTGDLDNDGLDDFATTNKLGFDPGSSESQEPPSVGGTVYTRKGTNGVPIWTTSGLKMDIYAWTTRLPDVVGTNRPEVGVSTYVPRRSSVPIPIDLPLLGFTRYIPRVYLLEGSAGAKQWHRRSDWVYSPGNIDGRGKPDLMLGTYRVKYRKNKSILDQTAVDGYGKDIWKRSLTWNYDTMPCPRDACFAWAWGWLDWSPNYQPDRVRDSLFAQEVQQNQAFEDHNTRGIDGRNGRVRFEDETDARIQTAGTAIDGRGSDLVAFEYGKEDNEVRVSARDGRNRMLWTGMLGGPDGLVPRRSGFWAQGFKLEGDRCGDLVINGWERDNSFYGVFDGGSGRLKWWRWTGPKREHPRITQLIDRNGSC